MIVVNWIPLVVVGGFVALAALACIIEWRWLAAEVPSGRDLGVPGPETRGPEPRGL